MKRKIIDSPLNWYGGKGGDNQRKLLKRILDLIDSSKAERFVDVFGGSGIVSINTNIGERVFNDKNLYLTHFFRVLQDENLRNKFKEKITLTLYSEIEFNEAKKRLLEQKALREELEQPSIDKIVDFYVATMQSRNATGAMIFNQTWRCKGKNRRGMAMAVSSWLKNIDENLPDVLEKLREIEVTNQDVFDCLERWDGEKTTFYLDPPYELNTRKVKKAYGDFELSEEEHVKIVKKLLSIKGQAIVSGYDSDIYNKLVDYGWNKEEINLKTATTVKGNNNGNRKEIIWNNIKN
ncbi:DNA adenine methylase [Clostridium butyricum]|uniref:DNA adenine methylase n=1 Tax=Clostridium butyricum TaxID=1492 RepID=UPI0018A97304|nr:DNA adenine methylase [Clostridium butyricum]